MPHGHGPPPQELAGRWARLGGGLLDALIIVVINAILVGPTVRWERIDEADVNSVNVVGGAGTVLAQLAAALIVFLYYWLQHAKWGRTLGKRAAGTRLVRAADGAAVSSGQAAWRIGFAFLLNITVGVLTCGFGGWLALINPAWILWDSRRQALHDKVAKTVVVKVRPGDPDPYAER
jgi:uncharacterized RDD family membrane protein YckC